MLALIRRALARPAPAPAPRLLALDNLQGEMQGAFVGLLCCDGQEPLDPAYRRVAMSGLLHMGATEQAIGPPELFIWVPDLIEFTAPSRTWEAAYFAIFVRGTGGAPSLVGKLTQAVAVFPGMSITMQPKSPIISLGQGSEQEGGRWPPRS